VLSSRGNIFEHFLIDKRRYKITSTYFQKTANMSAMDLDAPVSIAPQIRGEQTNAT
jgi:hypothetical protein